MIPPSATTPTVPAGWVWSWCVSSQRWDTLDPRCAAVLAAYDALGIPYRRVYDASAVHVGYAVYLPAWANALRLAVCNHDWSSETTLLGVVGPDLFAACLADAALARAVEAAAALGVTGADLIAFVRCCARDRG